MPKVVREADIFRMMNKKPTPVSHKEIGFLCFLWEQKFYENRISTGMRVGVGVDGAWNSTKNERFSQRDVKKEGLRTALIDLFLR